MDVKETLCTRCDIRRVCKYADSFVDLVFTVDQIYVDKEIHRVEVKCKEFREPQVTIF